MKAHPDRQDLPERNAGVALTLVASPGTVPLPRQAEPGARPVRPLRIALVGTRGVPASYGGFETAVEEVGRRLVQRGHEVTVYCRGAAEPVREYLGMRLVHLPAVSNKHLETLSHTGLSAAHLFAHRPPDVAVVFNAANAPFLPVIKARGIPVAVHMDGMEWRRGKWGGGGRRYYRLAESIAVRLADALIADARGIQDYYRDEFGTRATLITYGAPVLTELGSDRLAEVGIRPGAYHLVVARFEPENHVHVAVEAMLNSNVRHPLVVVGSAPYAAAHTQHIERLAALDPRIRLLGSVYDQELLDQVYAHALTYVHGHSVGGTNPSLLRAMGAQTAVLAYDVIFNREVLGRDGRFFANAEQLTPLLEAAETDPREAAARGGRLQERAAALYRWDEVARRYEQLCADLADGVPQRAAATGRRLSSDR